MFRILIFIFLTFVFLSKNILISQTGPAGVGTSANNVLWLKADKGTSSTTNSTSISFWNDQSGNSINVSQSVAVQQPSFATNIFNGFPAILFDNNNTAGQNDFLTAPDNPKLDNTSGYSFFTTTRMNFIGGDARCIVSKRTSIDIDEAFMLFYWSPSYFHLDIDGLGNRFSTTPLTYTTNTNYMMNALYNGTLPPPQRSKIYQEEQLLATAFESSALVPNKPSPLNIGCTHASNNRPFGGYIAEVIIYTVTVNDAQRTIVNNYTSAKYNIPLSANDKYLGDTPINGNYDFEVAGVGRESSGSNPTFSASICAGLGINTVSGLDVGDYILAGHSSTVNAQITTDIAGMTGLSNARWQRIWYLDITNTGSNINADVDFDMIAGGTPTTLGPASNYVLLYRSSLTGSWTELTTASSASGNIVKFNSYPLTLDGYYTIGTRNYLISPLPIELLNFDAEDQGQKVALNWATKSEKNTNYFNVERSSDGLKWEIISNVKAAENSNSTLYYETEDNAPLYDYSYYRLKIIDMDNSFTYTPIKSIYRSKKEEFVIFYPNPTSDILNLTTSYIISKIKYKIFDVTNKELSINVIYQTEDKISFDFSNLEKGMYFINVTAPDGTEYSSKRIILK